MDSSAVYPRDKVRHHRPVTAGRWLGDGGLSPTLIRANRMAIYGYLQNSGFDPETISIMTTAYEAVRSRLGLTDRSDPLTQLVARKVIELAQTGIRDPAQLADRVLADVGKS